MPHSQGKRKSTDAKPEGTPGIGIMKHNIKAILILHEVHTHKKNTFDINTEK